MMAHRGRIKTLVVPDGTMAPMAHSPIPSAPTDEGADDVDVLCHVVAAILARAMSRVDGAEEQPKNTPTLEEICE